MNEFIKGLIEILKLVQKTGLKKSLLHKNLDRLVALAIVFWAGSDSLPYVLIYLTTSSFFCGKVFGQQPN